MTEVRYCRGRGSPVTGDPSIKTYYRRMCQPEQREQPIYAAATDEQIAEAREGAPQVG
jgi:hypothetical protein